MRQPSGGPNKHSLWLNVLAQHVAAPPPAPVPATGVTGKLKAWFWRAMEIEGESEIRNAEAQSAATQAMVQEFHDQAWQPVHQFLLRHKLAADTAGIVLDTVGVIAGVIFVFVAAPELLAAGTAAAVVGLVTGTAATAGSVVLFLVDGVTYAAEVSGNEAIASKIEDNKTVQWVRIGATVMLLPDVAVGGLRSLQEIGKLAGEARDASAASAEAVQSTAEARARLARISNSDRHPGPVSRRLRKVRAFEREAQIQAQAVEAANSRIRGVAVRDIGVFQGATLAGTALMTAAPPGLAMSAAQNRRDEDYKASLIPRGGMPKDVRLEMRVIGYSTPKTP